jgi:hypothetical protein
MRALGVLKQRGQLQARDKANIDAALVQSATCWRRRLPYAFAPDSPGVENASWAKLSQAVSSMLD